MGLTFTGDRFASFCSVGDLEGLDVVDTHIVTSSLPALDMLSLLLPDSFDEVRWVRWANFTFLRCLDIMIVA